MSEAVWRLLVSGGAAAAALLAAFAARRWRRRTALVGAAGHLDLSGLDGRLLFFSSSGCRSCDVARERLVASGAAYREVRYDDEPEVHRTVGVTAVPLIVARSAAGEEAGRIAGRPSRAALRRLLEAAEGK